MNVFEKIFVLEKQLDLSVKLGHDTGVAVPISVVDQLDAARSPIRGVLFRTIIY